MSTVGACGMEEREGQAGRESGEGVVWTDLLDGTAPVGRRLVDEVVPVTRGDGHEAVVEARGILWVGRHGRKPMRRNVGRPGGGEEG